MANRIEQVIGDIEEYIDGCKMAAFSNTKIIVDRPQIEEYLDELRQYTPEEVKKYQRMLNNRDKILSDARKKSSLPRTTSQKGINDSFSHCSLRNALLPGPQLFRTSYPVLRK